MVAWKYRLTSFSWFVCRCFLYASMLAEMLCSAVSVSVTGCGGRDKKATVNATWSRVDELHGAVVLDGVDVGDEPEHAGKGGELGIDGERGAVGAGQQQSVVGVHARQRADVPQLAVAGRRLVEAPDGVADPDDARVPRGGKELQVAVDGAVDFVHEVQRADARDGVFVVAGRLLLHVADVGDVVADVLAGQHHEVVDQVLLEVAEREVWAGRTGVVRRGSHCGMLAGGRCVNFVCAKKRDAVRHVCQSGGVQR